MLGIRTCGHRMVGTDVPVMVVMVVAVVVGVVAAVVVVAVVGTDATTVLGILMLKRNCILTFDGGSNLFY